VVGEIYFREGGGIVISKGPLPSNSKDLPQKIIATLSGRGKGV